MSECITCHAPAIPHMLFCTPRCSRLHYAFKYVCERARNSEPPAKTAEKIPEAAAKISGQSRLTSILENLNRSLVSGSTATLIHFGILVHFANLPDVKTAASASVALWVIMFANSMIWGYIIRRIYERHGVHLDARSLYRRIRGVL